MSSPFPPITGDLDQAERDLREHGICFVRDLLSPAQLDDVRGALYRAAGSRPGTWCRSLSS